MERKILDRWVQMGSRTPILPAGLMEEENLRPSRRALPPPAESTGPKDGSSHSFMSHPGSSLLQAVLLNSKS